MKLLTPLSIILLLFVFGCSDDPCKDAPCGINASCDEGICTCIDGWKVNTDGQCTIEDKCFGVDCGQFGTCDESNSDCYCDRGYEKDTAGKCDIAVREKYIGNWRGSHVIDNTSSGQYDISVVVGTNGTSLKIVNTMNLECPATSAPLEVIIDYAFLGGGSISTSTCPEHNQLEAYASLIDQNTMRVNTNTYFQGTFYNYEGVYTRL